MSTSSEPATTRKQRDRISAAGIARELGVSAATVSYALNGRAGVSEPLRRRIVELANEAGVRPKTGVTSKRLARVVALIVPNITNPMFTQWSQEIITESAREGFEVLVIPTDDDPDRMVSAAKMLVARSIDGAIVLAAHKEDSTSLGILREGRVPFTFLSRRSDYFSADFVGIDDYHAARDLARHMLEHSPQKPATVIGPRFSSSSSLRERGFVDEFASAGLSVRGAYKVSTELSREGGRLAAQHLLSLAHRPDAILCGSDEIAVGILELFHEKGLTPGTDAAVTGFDGLEQSTSSLVGLTTIIQPRRRMAIAATRQLLERIHHPNRTEHRAEILAHSVHIGRTCGCTETSRTKEKK